jgi:hypothetical protein
MKLYSRDYEHMPGAAPRATRSARLGPEAASDPDNLHSRIYNRHHFCSAVKTPSQFGGGASIWNCAIRRR